MDSLSGNVSILESLRDSPSDREEEAFEVTEGGFLQKAGQVVTPSRETWDSTPTSCTLLVSAPQVLEVFLCAQLAHSIVFFFADANNSFGWQNYNFFNHIVCILKL